MRGRNLSLAHIIVICMAGSNDSRDFCARQHARKELSMTRVIDAQTCLIALVDCARGLRPWFGDALVSEGG